MSPNRRIFLNIIATYGRSLYALVLGLFTARWVLEALGQVDFGLYGVVGGLTAFIAFFNGLLATAVGRFYAVSIGAAQKNSSEGLESCRQWFSIAVFIHTVIPIILMMIGYPIGEWAVRHWLIIPPDRIESCVWVFRFVCISCFIGMVNVPFQAMYTAKQYIAELTIYSFATTTLNFLFLYYMVSNPGDWLAKYALWGMLMSVIPQLIICIRAIIVFPECRFKLSYVWSTDKFKLLLYFISWWAFGCFGGVLRGQGIQILINKFFGARVNASMTIANSLNSHTMTLSSAMTGAFQPAIVSSYGAGDYDKMRALAYRACKFSMLFILIFMLPLALELREILRIWLVNPPEYIYGLCMVIFVMTLIDQSAVGHMLAVNARGKIALYQSVLGTSLLLSLPLAWLFCYLGFGVYFVAVALLISMTFCAWGRVWFARSLVGMSARYWAFSIVLPVVVILVIAIAVGLSPRLFMEESFLRIIMTTTLCEVTFIPLVWFILLDKSERQFIKGKIPWLKK